jgi:hypothetical protein
VRARLPKLSEASVRTNHIGACGVKAINDRVAGWLYKLPDYKIPMLQPKIDDLLKKSDGTS